MAAGVLCCAIAHADDTPQQKLDAVEKALQESRTRQAELTQQASELAADIATLREQSVSAAQAAQQHEAALSQLEDKLTSLGVDEKRKVDQLARQRETQRKLLMALVRLAHNPPEGLVLAPGNPVDMLRGALLLDQAVKPIEAQSKALSDDIVALDRVRNEIADTWQKYSAEHDALVADQLRINTIIAHKADLQQRATKGAAEIGRKQERLATQAQDLHELIDKLEAEHRQHDDEQRKAEEQRTRIAAATPPPRDKEALALRAPTPTLVDPGHRALPPATTAPAATDPGLADPERPRNGKPPLDEAHGQMLVPASGRVVKRYGENDAYGVSNKGITIATRPGAQVVAPYDGRILFAGPFKGYGQILIIGHGDGYHSLLAGLDRVDGGVGQWLVAGEPIGVMAGGSEKPRLYLELRHNNQPINPAPWLAPRDEKVSG